MAEDEVDIVDNQGASYLRAHVHHFTLFSCCKTCDPASGITYWKHSDAMAFYVHNTTEKVLLLVTLPLNYSVASDRRHAIQFWLGGSLPGGNGGELGGHFERQNRTEYVSYPSGETPEARFVCPKAKKQRVELQHTPSERLLICTIEDEPSSSLVTPISPSITDEVAPASDALIGSGRDKIQIVRYYDSLTISGGNGLALHQSRLDVGCQRLCRVHKDRTALAHVAMALAGLSEEQTTNATLATRSRWLSIFS